MTPTVVYWLFAGALLVTVCDQLSSRGHHGVSAAAGEMPSSAAMSDVYKRRFMFGRRSAVGDAPWTTQAAVRRAVAASRRRFKFGKKSDPTTAAAEKRKLLMFGKKWSRDLPSADDRRMFKFGKRN